MLLGRVQNDAIYIPGTVTGANGLCILGESCSSPMIEGVESYVYG